MKRIFLSLIFSLLCLSGFAQQHSFYFEGGLTEDYRDLDAMVYYPQMDKNDELSALVKVTFIDELDGVLSVDAGVGNLVLREVKPNGELWLYLSQHTKTLKFECGYYASPEPINVNLIKGSVYRLKLRTSNGSSASTSEADGSSASFDVNYLKFVLNKENAFISLGKTTSYELVFRERVSTHLYTRLVEYGTYYYRVEHPECETLSGMVVVGATTSDFHLELMPNLPSLSINSEPQGATLFINGREMGETPCKVLEYDKNSDVEIVLVMEGYYPRREIVSITDSAPKSFTFDLEPRFATVTCTCEDPTAELWLNGEKVGYGKWSGEVDIHANHTLEARKDGYSPRRKIFRVGDNAGDVYAVPAPSPLYGTVHIMSTPELCNVVIDGQSVGTTPFIRKYNAGRHIVELSCEGYESDVFEINVRSNAMNEFTRTLKMELKNVATIPNNEIHYTTTDGQQIKPYKASSFGARIVSNTYSGGKGVMVFDKDVRIIGQEAFYYCENLKSITLPATVGDIGWLAFAGCRSLEEFKSAWSSADSRAIVIDGVLKAFAPAGLTRYVVEEGVREIGEGAFYICDHLEQIIIPRGVESIGDSAFFGTSLTDIIIPEGVKSIGQGICYECLDLATITLPSTLEKLGDYAFYGCESTVEVHSTAPHPPMMEIDVDGFNNSFEYQIADYRIYVPTGSVEAYRSAEGWNKYADKICDIEEKYSSKAKPAVSESSSTAAAKEVVEQPSTPAGQESETTSDTPVSSETSATTEASETSDSEVADNAATESTEATAEEERVYVKVDKMPKFLGGDLLKFQSWVAQRFRVPEKAVGYGVDGRLIVKFIVEKDGSISNVEFLKSPNRLYNEEMMRVFKRAPKWQPGYQDGEPVRVVHIMPMNFKIRR